MTNQRGCPIQQTPKQEESAEVLKQKAAKSALRRKMELEKREVSKKKTMDRLLKKKDSKVINTNVYFHKDTIPFVHGVSFHKTTYLYTLSYFL